MYIVRCLAWCAFVWRGIARLWSRVRWNKELLKAPEETVLIMQNTNGVRTAHRFSSWPSIQTIWCLNISTFSRLAPAHPSACLTLIFANKMCVSPLGRDPQGFKFSDCQYHMSRFNRLHQASPKAATPKSATPKALPQPAKPRRLD